MPACSITEFSDSAPVWPGKPAGVSRPTLVRTRRFFFENRAKTPACLAFHLLKPERDEGVGDSFAIPGCSAESQ